MSIISNQVSLLFVFQHHLQSGFSPLCVISPFCVTRGSGARPRMSSAGARALMPSAPSRAPSCPQPPPPSPCFSPALRNSPSPSAVFSVTLSPALCLCLRGGHVCMCMCVCELTWACVYVSSHGYKGKSGGWPQRIRETNPIAFSFALSSPVFFVSPWLWRWLWLWLWLCV